MKESKCYGIYLWTWSKLNISFKEVSNPNATSVVIMSNKQTTTTGYAYDL